LQNFALQPMEILQWYNSVPVKDNCALFAPTPIFGPMLSNCVILIFPLPTPVAMATNFGTKIDYSSAPLKITASCFRAALFIHSFIHSFIWLRQHGP